MAPRLLRAGFFVYWLAFMVFTAHYGQYPGLIAHPERWQYPYGAVLAVCALLTVLLVILYAILAPAKFPYSWRRLVAAMVYAVALFFMGISLVATDLPGYYYVPLAFGLATIACVLGITFVSAVCALRGGRERAT